MKLASLALSIGVLFGPRIAMAADEDPPPNPETEVGDKHDAAQKKTDPGASSPARPEVDAVSEPPKREDKDDPEKKLSISGYVETYYQWNFNRPSNGISAYRGYDNRHGTFTLQNAVLDVGFRATDILARVALQVGHAASVIYQDEPRAEGGGGANASDGEMWKYLQRASLGWQASERLLIEAGIFPSTTGVESLAVKENWNWSRSMASLRLPNYQTGVRGTWLANEHVDVFAAVINGWNSVVDNNDEKSFVLGAHYKQGTTFTLSGSYFGGVERPGGAPEGRAWRHGVEAWAQLDVTDALSIAADGSGGLEQTTFGAQWWASAAAYARVKTTEWLYLAGRVDRTWEDTAGDASGGSEPILIPVKDVTSGVATVDVRPTKGFSTRLELKHDFASAPLYFRGTVDGDGSPTNPYVPNAKSQTTLLLGATVWM